MIRELGPPVYIGDGLYMEDEGDWVAIAVNHHANTVAFIDIEDIDKVISYLQKVKETLKEV
jgi:hypothetical protein